MISVLAALVFFAWLAIAALRRPAFALVSVFLLWQILLKILGIVYLDLAGPIYSDEVFADVGGRGSSAPLLILFVWVPLFVFYLFLGPRPGARPPLPEGHLDERGITFGDIVVALLGGFVLILYADMILRGNIPYFTGVERFEYQGGVFHVWFQNLVFLITFLTGYIFARARILLGVWDVRCVALLFLFFAYLFLTGHRFGAFYVMASFMALALAAPFLAKSQGWPIAPATVKATLTQKIARSPVAVAAVALAAVGMVLAAMIHNLLVVREYGDTAWDELFDRLFVQPVHLYWLTWERFESGLTSGPVAAFEFMFLDPFDPTRNSGIQYLMYLALGADKAASIFIDHAQDYAGGYPDILVELGGIWLGLPIAIAAAVFTAILYRLCVVALCRGHFLTSMFAIYVCHGFLNFYLGGMMNFLLAWTYWLKIALLLLAIVVDQLLDRHGLRLFPWVWFTRTPKVVTQTSS